MLDFILKYLGELIAAAIAGFMGWFFERKRKKAETNKVEADYSKAIMEIYQEALTDLKARYDEKYESQNREYDLKFKSQKQEYDLKFESLNLKMDKMTKDQEMWKNKYTSLKKEFDNYKKKKAPLPPNGGITGSRLRETDY